MKVLRIKLIAGALSCVCSTGFAADDSALGLKPSAGSVRLKLQPSLIAISPDNKEPVPLFIDAAHIEGHQDRDVEAEGAVRLRKRGQAVFADWLRYDQSADEISAEGNVRLEQRGDVLEGTKLRLNLETERGAVENPKYRVKVNATEGRGSADRLLLEGEGKYRLLGGNYTTCGPGNDAWFVRADDFEIDKGREIGTARGANIVFGDHTIFYAPYLSFSLDRQRKSGFLSPIFGTTGNSGTEFSIPYYWNIAPNRDATFTPRVMAKRGTQLGSEIRYLDPSYSGELRYEVLPNDRVKNGETRDALSLRHTQTLPGGWYGALDIQKVSDDTYFTDLSTQLALTSQTNLPRMGTLGRSGTWGNGGTWGFTAMVQRWQTLQADPLNPVATPYSRAPQFTFNASQQDLGPADFELASSFTDFTHPTLVNGKRSVVYPAVSLPLQTAFGYVTPKVGLHVTNYSLDQSAPTGPTSQNRAVPIFSTESGVVFERGMNLQGQKLTQTLEPKLYYVYIPTRDQNQLPVFDSGLQDINFATLYSENQFSGADRINDANEVTLGVTSRFLHQDTGSERLRLGLAQRYYFKTQEVTLPGVAPRSSASSDLRAAVSGTVAPHWTADFGWQYTTALSHTQRLDTGFHYQPEPGRVFNATYAYAANLFRQVDVSAQWPLAGGWSTVARWNYSTLDRKLLEGIAGFEYNGGCWAVRFVAHSFATAATNQVTSLFVQLELSGVSNIGSNPLALLVRSIPGYSRQSPRPAPSEEPFPLR